MVRRVSGLHFRVELGVAGEGRSLFALRRTGTRESHWDQGSNLHGGGQGVSILIPFSWTHGQPVGDGAKPGANVLVADTPGIWLGPPKDGLQYYTNTPREHTEPWFVRASVKLFRERHYRGGGYIWREGGLIPLVNVGGRVEVWGVRFVRAMALHP